MPFRLVSNYYVRSTLIAVACLVSVGCASASGIAATASRVPFASLAAGDAKAGRTFTQFPVVIEFREGDVLPFELTVDSTLVAQDPTPARASFIVKRPFFLLMRSDGPPRVSLDGVDFDASPGGSFAIGLGVRPDGAKGTAKIGWWAAR